MKLEKGFCKHEHLNILQLVVVDLHDYAMDLGKVLEWEIIGDCQSILTL